MWQKIDKDNYPAFKKKVAVFYQIENKTSSLVRQMRNTPGEGDMISFDKHIAFGRLHCIDERGFVFDVDGEYNTIVSHFWDLGFPEAE